MVYVIDYPLSEFVRLRVFYLLTLIVSGDSKRPFLSYVSGHAGDELLYGVVLLGFQRRFGQIYALDALPAVSARYFYRADDVHHELAAVIQRIQVAYAVFLRYVICHIGVLMRRIAAACVQKAAVAQDVHRLDASWVVNAAELRDNVLVYRFGLIFCHTRPPYLGISQYNLANISNKNKIKAHIMGLFCLRFRYLTLILPAIVYILLGMPWYDILSKSNLPAAALTYSIQLCLLSRSRSVW